MSERPYAILGSPRPASAPTWTTDAEDRVAVALLNDLCSNGPGAFVGRKYYIGGQEINCTHLARVAMRVMGVKP